MSLERERERRIVAGTMSDGRLVAPMKRLLLNLIFLLSHSNSQQEKYRMGAETAETADKANLAKLQLAAWATQQQLLSASSSYSFLVRC